MESTGEAGELSHGRAAFSAGPERLLSGRPVGHVGMGVQLLGASTHLSIDDSIRAIHAGMEGGSLLLDTSDVYAPNRHWTGHGERIVGEALRQWPHDRDRVVVATKGGHLLGAHPMDITPDGRPEHLRAACEASLKALGRDVIDLYQLHSVDPDIPLEASLGALIRLRDEGKIREIGLSNVGRSQLASALAVTPIASVQNRYSLLALKSRAVLDMCAQRGILFLPWSPLGRDDAKNIGDRVAALASIAELHGVSPQRVALAWLLAQGDHVLPLSGATKIANILDNLSAATLDLTAEELATLSGNGA